MRLALYSSLSGAAAPNLVALQDEDLFALPTVLVCPLSATLAVTTLRVEVKWKGQRFIACPELTRPIRRTALRAHGFLDHEQSRQIVERMLLLLAR